MKPLLAPETLDFVQDGAIVARMAIYSSSPLFRISVEKLEGRVSKFHFSEKRRYDPISDPPKSRTDFWLKKPESNVVRDQLVKADLERLGWRVITVWECELREPERNCE